MGKKKKSDKTATAVENAEPGIEEIPDEDQVPKKSMDKTASKSIENASKEGIGIPKLSSKVTFPKADEKLDESAKKESLSSPPSKSAITSGQPEKKSDLRLGDSKVSFSETRVDAKKPAKKKDKKKSKAPDGEREMADTSVLDSKINFDSIENDEVPTEKQAAENKKKKPKKKEPKQKKPKPEPPQIDSSQIEAPETAVEEASDPKKKEKKSKPKKLAKEPSITPSKKEPQSKTELPSEDLATSKSDTGTPKRERSSIGAPKSGRSSKNVLAVSDSTLRAQSTGTASTLNSETKSKKRKLSKGTSDRALKLKSQTSMDVDDISYSTASSEESITDNKRHHKDKKKKKAKKPKREKSQEPISEEVSKPSFVKVSSSEKPDEKHGKKKGKKDKKSEVTFDPYKVEEKEEGEDDDEEAFLAQILKQKAAKLAQAKAEEKSVSERKETDEPPTPKSEKTEKSEKKGPKKKLSKKEKARLTAELAEKMRIEAEQEAAMEAEREKIRLEQEKKTAIEKEKIETAEQHIREEQLDKSTEYIEHVIIYNKELARNEREQSDWQLYIECGKLPNPSLCDKMNTYLHLWEKNIEHTTIDEAAERTEDVLKLLNDLEYLIDNADEEQDNRTKENWKWVRQLFRERQKESMDVATYRLLRNVEKNLHRIDIPTADFNFHDDDMNLSIWLRVQLPVPLPNPRRPPKPRIDVSFPDVNLQMLLPITIDCENMAIRVMYLKYDHFSDSCCFFCLPYLPPHYELGLRDMVKNEWRVKLKYKYDHRDKKSRSIQPEEAVEVTGESNMNVGDEKIAEPVLAPVVPAEDPVDFAPDENIPVVPYKKLDPTASEYAVAVEERTYMRTRKSMLSETPENILNLRKYSILGGVYYLNALYQPPQPQDFVTIDMTITSLYLPKKIEHVPFSVNFTPPPPTEPGVRKLPEEIEEEMKRVEEELDKLIMVTLTWPQHVIFLELPLVVQWDEEEKTWSKENVHDLKHNEEKGILTFRTGAFGIFGLAALRYANLPYQAWELRPEADDSVTVNITATILVLEFNIKDGLICISQLQNSPNNALQDMVGKYIKFYRLKKMMKEAGIDIFPEPDAFCYIEGSCEKNWSMEKHLYYNMATLSNCFNFAWSRWNLAAGRRNIVLQLREYFPSKPKQKSHSMLLVTPLKATFVDCTEVSQVFSAEDIDSSSKLSCDLYNLMKATSGIAIRKKVQDVRKENIFVLSELLISTRVLSFS